MVFDDLATYYQMRFTIDDDEEHMDEDQVTHQCIKAQTDDICIHCPLWPCSFRMHVI